ncbi:MAG: DUF4175 family protein [Candidatus Zixiibacteriota bacterium]
MSIIKSPESLIQRLKNILLKQRLVLLGSGLLATFAAVLVTWFVLSLFASIMILPVWFKLTLLIGAGLTTLFLFIRFAVSRLFNGNLESIAVHLEEKYPELKGRLIAAIEFVKMKKTPGYSKELVSLTITQALTKAGDINFNEVITFNTAIKSGRNFAIAAALALAILFMAPGFFGYSLEVYSNPTTEIAPPLGFNLSATPGSTEWIKYRDIEIGGVLKGDRFPEKAEIHYRFVDGNWQLSEIDLKKLRHSPLLLGDSLQFGITLRQVNKSFDYYVKAGRAETELQKVDVVDKPRVNGIKLSIFYPSYTGLEPTVIDGNNGTFSAVVGSRTNVKIAANAPVETAEMIFEDQSRLPMKVTNSTAEASLVVEKTSSYEFHLVDHLGEENPDPIEYHITAVPDEYPAIDVLRPGFDVNLTEEMMLPLKVRIFDDYGFTSLVLKFQVVYRGNPSDEHVAVLHFPERIKTKGEIDFNWDMDKLNMFPGDYCTYYFEVADNDKISGPKITKTRQFIARLPSLDEIITDAETETAGRISNAENMLRRGKDLAQKMQNAARKLKAQQQNINETDWQQQKDLQNIVEKNSEVLTEIEKNAQEMEKSIEKLAENALLSREIMERMQEIQKLFEEVATPEMKAAQERLMEALKNMDQDLMREAMQDYQLSQEEMLKRLERTLALLKRMQVMQKMEAMMRQAEQLAERQEESNKNTESTESEKLPSLSQNENAIKSDLEKLQKEVAELKKMAEEAGMKDSKELEEFSKALEQTDAAQDMQAMSNSLNQSQKEQAKQQGKKAHSKLAELANKMQQQFSAMKGGDQEKTQKEMRAAIDDANYLSRNQEELLDQSAMLDPQSLMLRDMASKQQDLAKSCNGLKNRISELGQQSPFVAAELDALVEQALQNMDLAMQGLSDKQQVQAKRCQQDAMVNLNQASIRLMESLEQQKQCNNASNCSNPMQQLESMCNKQNQLNQQTQGMCNNPGGANPKQGGQGQREDLKRLAGEQGAIRKSMEDLAREFGNSRQILGRIDDIASEMKEVEEELASGQVGQPTTEKQLKIYSRLLEATRSLQRRDFTEQRKANTATQTATYIPPSLSSDILNDRVNLEDRLRQYLGDGYPKQYEEQIKAYFKALLQIKSQSTGTPAPGK